MMIELHSGSLATYIYIYIYYIYIISSPNLGFGIAVPGRERE